MKATKIAWPGEHLALFRGDSENTNELNNLTNDLKDKYSTKYLAEGEICHYIIDVI